MDIKTGLQKIADNSFVGEKLFDHSADIEYFRFLVLRDFLYKVYTKKLKDDRIKMLSCWGLKNDETKFISKARPDSYSNLGLIEFNDMAVYFRLLFDKKEYLLTTIGLCNMHLTASWIFKVSIACLDDTVETSAQGLLDYLLITSMAKSSIKNKMIFIKDNNFKHAYLENTEIIEPKDIDLNDIFLPKNISVQIKRFITEIINYGIQSTNTKNKSQLRFLLSGLPGTGKSQIINAIIKAVYGKTTIVVLNGIDFKMTEIIDFCKIFDPCLLVIDDMDFIARKREENFNSNSLVNILHSLDGMFPESLFLLGATNDKFLVDKAASRPGRFDMILDISKINEDDYLKLIKRETQDESLISLFNKEVLGFLKNKKVTGAFIVNLIKQLVSIKQTEGKVELEDVKSILNLTYEGFYLDPVQLGKVIGFRK